jgi:2-dehydropantoate 2-reductase
MKIAVIGTGAIGMLFGGFLAKGGCDVTMVSVSQTAVMEKLSRDGVRVVADSYDIAVPVKAAMAGDLTEEFDWIILFTKSQGSAAALEKCRAMIGKDTYIMTLQNGLGNIENAEKFAKPDHIICGVLTMPAAVTGVGEIRTCGDDRKSSIGMADGSDCAFLHEAADIMNRCELPAVIVDDVEAIIWDKLAINSGFNPVSSLCLLPQSRLHEAEDGEQVVFDIMHETLGLAKALGINVDEEAAMGRARAILVTHEGHFPSMAQDVMNKRRTEIDSINGEVIKRARAINYPVPRNETVYALMKLLEVKYLSE